MRLATLPDNSLPVVPPPQTQQWLALALNLSILASFAFQRRTQSSRKQRAQLPAPLYWTAQVATVIWFFASVTNSLYDGVALHLRSPIDILLHILLWIVIASTLVEHRRGILTLKRLRLYQLGYLVLLAVCPAAHHAASELAIPRGLIIASRSSLLLCYLLLSTSAQDPQPSNLPPWKTASVLNQWLMLWFWSLSGRILKKDFAVEDLKSYTNVDEETLMLKRLQHQQHQQPGRTLARHVWHVYRRDLAKLLAPSVISAAARVASIESIRHMLDFLQNPNKNVSGGLTLAVAVASFGFAADLATVQGRIICNRIGASLRFSLSNIVFEKTLKLKVDGLEDSGPGSINALISVDADRIARNVVYILHCVTLLFLFLFCFMLLAWEFGVSAVTLSGGISFLVVIVSLPASIYLFRPDHPSWAKAGDRRVRLISSIINCLGAVELSAIESTLSTKYLALRELELFWMHRFLSQTIRIATTQNSLYAICRVATCWGLAWSMRYATNRFPYADAMMLAGLIEAIGSSFFLVVWMGTDYIAAISSFKRISRFTAVEERLQLSDVDGRRVASAPHPVVLDNAAFSADNRTVLNSITVTLAARSLTVVTGSVGSVGSGKSLFLRALLGELQLESGTCQATDSYAKSYVTQEPTIMANNSIRDNILFYQPFDEEMYGRVLEATALQEDLRRKERYDQTSAEELSGGQKQRVCLARALYAQAQLVLLDDCFSALDPRTAELCWQGCFGSNGLLKDATVVLACGDSTWVSKADRVVHLDKQTMTHSTSATRPVRRNLVFSPDESVPAFQPLPFEDEDVSAPTKERSEVDNEVMSTRHDVWSAACFHIRSVARLVVCNLFLDVLAWPVFYGGFTLYLKYWSSAAQSAEYNLYLWGLGLAAMTVYYIPLAHMSWSYGLLEGTVMSGRRVHQYMLSGFLRASLKDLRVSPGYLLNRFTSDPYQHENEFCLPFAAFHKQLVAIVVALWFILAAVPSLWVFVLALGIVSGVCLRYFTRLSTRLRTLQVSALTPLLSLASDLSRTDTLQTVRAFSTQNQVQTAASSTIAQSTVPFLLLNDSLAWFFLQACIASALMTFGLLSVATLSGSNSNLGPAMVQAVALPGLMQWILANLANFNISSLALTRMKSIGDLPKEEEEQASDRLKGQAWPAQGSVTYKDVSTRYNFDAPLALESLSFHVPAGSRIGICGRTGSGKSTLFSLLLRMLDSTEGTITIDGLDIAAVPRQQVRASLSAIPQEPMLLDLTIRENLDPEGLHTDQELWAALEATHCAFIHKLPGKLDFEVKNGGHLSRGEKQLLALARAFLRQRKILFLDEASSSLDSATDRAIQRALRSAFPECTMLVIAHRLQTIMDSDWIICLEQGRIQDQGKPEEVVQRGGSFFSPAKAS